jgi:hypothetical protein
MSKRRPDPPLPPNLQNLQLTVEQLHQTSHVPKKTIRRDIREDRLHATKRGGRYYISRTEALLYCGMGKPAVTPIIDRKMAASNDDSAA